MFPIASVFIPDGRISRVRLATITFPYAVFPWSSPGLSACSHTPVILTVYCVPRPYLDSLLLRSESHQLFRMGPAMCREFLCRSKVLPFPGMIQDHSPLALPGVHCYYKLMRQTYFLCSPPLLRFVRPVFAGCHKPLLIIGPSQRYLHRSFQRCLTPYPGSFCGAISHCFPQDIGLLPRNKGSAGCNIPHSNFGTGGVFGAVSILFCSDLFVCSPPWLLALYVFAQASSDFYFRAEHGSLPNRASDMLTARMRNWRCEDFHFTRSMALLAAPFPAPSLEPHRALLRQWAQDKYIHGCSWFRKACDKSLHLEI